MDTALRIAFTFLPEGVALIVGLVLAVLRRRSDRELAALAAAGFALHLVAVVLATVSVYASTGIRTAADLARYSQLGGVLGLVVIFTRLLGWILLLLAVFRRLPRATPSQDNAPTGRHALLDAQGGQVVAEEGQSLYPDDDREPGPSGLVGAGVGDVGARGFGEGPFGDGPFGERPFGGGPADETSRFRGPAGSDAPTEAVPIGRIPLRTRMPEPETAAAPELPSDRAEEPVPAGTGSAEEHEQVAEEDVHDPVEDELPVPDAADGVAAVEPDGSAGAAEVLPEEPDEDEVDETDVADDAAESHAATATDDADGPSEPDGSPDAVVEDVDADGDVVVDEAPETADQPDAGIDEVEGPEEEPAATVLTPVVARSGTGTADTAGPAAVPATERPPLPALTSTPVLLTDFSDDDAWEVARTAIVGPDDVDAPTNLEVVADPAYDDLTVEEAVELATGGEAGAAGHHPCVFLVDTTTTTQAGSPVLVVDLRESAGRSFRCAASEVQTLETILSTTRTSFADLAAAVADDGVFRGL